MDENKLGLSIEGISNTLEKMKLKPREGLRAESHWDLLLDLINELGGYIGDIIENYPDGEDLEDLQEQIDDIRNDLDNLIEIIDSADYIETINKILIKIADLYGKYDAIVLLLEEIKNILEQLGVVPVDLLVASGSIENENMILDVSIPVTLALEPNEVVLASDIQILTFSVNGQVQAEGIEYDYELVSIVPNATGAVINYRLTEEMNGVFTTNIIFNGRIIASGGRPISVLKSVEDISGQTVLPYVSKDTMKDITVFVNGQMYAVSLDYNLIRENGDPAGKVVQIVFNEVQEGIAYILEQYV